MVVPFYLMDKPPNLLSGRRPERDAQGDYTETFNQRPLFKQLRQASRLELGRHLFRLQTRSPGSESRLCQQCFIRIAEPIVSTQEKQFPNMVGVTKKKN